MNGLAMAVLLLALSPYLGAVTLRIMPSVLFAGRNVRLICRVPLDARHRWIDLGIPGVRLSGRSMDCDQEAMTFEFLIERVPCVAHVAICRIVNDDRKEIVRTLPLEIAGCEDGR